MLKIGQTVLNNLKTGKNLNVSRLLKSTIAEAKVSEIQEEPKPKKYERSQNNMVAAVFASLQNEVKTPLTDDKISKASDINELLSISEGSGVSRKHALKVVSTLAEWSSSGKTQLSEFENDHRFIKLCRILSKGAKVNRAMVSRSEDLSTVLSVTADDEAARLINNLTLPQMIKVMSTLTMRKRRSVLLLRTLAYNIAASGETLNLKQSADLLYSISVDIFLLDLSEVLDSLSEWILQNHLICRPQDVFSLFVTLATVNYLPTNSEELFKVLVPQLTISEARKPLVWLDFVWSLVILNQASQSHISSVLAPDFVEKIEDASVFGKVKLLNINGAAKYLMEGFTGETLSPLSEIHNVNIVRTKENGEMAECVLDTLKNLIQSDNLNFDVNTGLGFSIDVECLLDKKCNPLPITKENSNKTDFTKIALIAYDYHNMCIGKVEPTGANVLNSRLLEACGYKVLAIPYTEFKITDKLVHRVQYLESKLKNIVK
ncbi:Protein TBRG4-like Protein [Tribolium castaneum]|uniref:Protein TBRG4-like Protein n=1 Tax=Tribolium castaneum TaxID=7070 RepID=D6X3J3_TRICA|nr:Protein TBRG4-like Protein [Tribolium castaneum]